MRVYNSDIDDDDQETFTSSKVSEEGQESSVQRTVIPQPTKRGWEPGRPTRDEEGKGREGTDDEMSDQISDVREREKRTRKGRRCGKDRDPVGMQGWMDGWKESRHGTR